MTQQHHNSNEKQHTWKTVVYFIPTLYKTPRYFQSVLQHWSKKVQSSSPASSRGSAWKLWWQQMGWTMRRIVKALGEMQQGSEKVKKNLFLKIFVSYHISCETFCMLTISHRLWLSSSKTMQQMHFCLPLLCKLVHSKLFLHHSNQKMLFKF